MVLGNKWLRPPAAAQHLALSTSTLAKWRLRGVGPKFGKLGKAVVYDLDELDEFARGQMRSSTSSGEAV